METPNEALQQCQTTVLQLRNELDSREADFAMARAEWTQKAAQEAYLNELDALMRTELNSTLAQFADVVLQSLARRLEVLVGAIYVIYRPEEQEPYVAYTAGYGLRPEQVTSTQMRLGEGLVGQCARQTQSIEIDLKSSYRLEGATVGLQPQRLHLQPMAYNDVNHGVMELYLMNPLTEAQQALLQQATTVIAVTLDAKLKQAQIARMLEESRELLQEKMAQEEELRQNMEELTVTQEEMMRVEQEMSAQMRAMDNNMLMVQLDMEGNFLRANQAFCDLFGYTTAEVRQLNSHQLARNSEIQPETEKQMWHKLMNGQAHTIVYQQQNKKGETVWIDVTYAPVLDLQGVPYKVLAFGQDITAKKIAEQNMVRVEELENALEEVRAKEEEIGRLLLVTRENERQLQETEARYRDYIKQLSLKVKDLEQRLQQPTAAH